jgi:hypothetical protein
MHLPMAGGLDMNFSLVNHSGFLIETGCSDQIPLRTANRANPNRKRWSMN